MKIIEKLSDMMEEEMHDAQKYVECAMKWKDEDDLIFARAFYEMSNDEIKHAMMIHDNATRLINDYKQKGNEVPEKMQAVYDYLHEKHMDRYNDIKMMQAALKI